MLLRLPPAESKMEHPIPRHIRLTYITRKAFFVTTSRISFSYRNIPQAASGPTACYSGTSRIRWSSGPG